MPAPRRVVFIGHADHGKSTLLGRLLYDAGALSDERRDELERAVAAYAERFEFAFFLDALEEEVRERSTIDAVRVSFRGAHEYRVADVPGHQRYLQNMLSGAWDADIAVLVVSAVEGPQAQTRHHLQLVRLLGIRQLVVAITKMDARGFEQRAFEATRDEVSRFVGRPVPCVPVAAREGINVVRASGDLAWYRGPTLLETLDAVQLSERPAKAGPLRFVVQCQYPIDGRTGLLGRVESGTLAVGAQLVFQPSGSRATVRSIRVFEGSRRTARADECVGLVLAEAPGSIARGEVAGPPGDPPRLVTSMTAEVAALGAGLARGDEVRISCGTADAEAVIEAVGESTDLRTGEVLTRTGRLDPGESGKVSLRTRPLVIEPFASVPGLGRFVLARDGEPAGVGIAASQGA